jgi:hypothetical protein
MKARIGDWENELWSLINIGDGTNCPHYKSCQYKKNRSYCLSRDEAYAEEMNLSLDSDTLFFSSTGEIFPKVPECVSNGRIFTLVRKLAQYYAEKLGIMEIPVQTEITNHICFDQPIEIRLVPLKSAHGAVWRLRDGWVIHLNSKDSSARRRFTLYHEIFHILAHCNATPVFKKASSQKQGSFNELLADHFSAVMIMPEEIVQKKWPEVNDISKMAAVFDVPEPIMYCGLKHFRLI